MPALSGRVLYRDGSPAGGVKIEGLSSHGGMVEKFTDPDGSFSLITPDTTGIFTKVFVKGQLVAEQVRGGGRILFIK